MKSENAKLSNVVVPMIFGLMICLFILSIGRLFAGTQGITESDIAADISVKGSMKKHFRKGMKDFINNKYDRAIPELIASTMIVDPYTWDYWYAEAYATLGAIYEFHNSEPNHNKLAYQYYLLALKLDPKTKSANYYIDQVRPEKAKSL